MLILKRDIMTTGLVRVGDIEFHITGIGEKKVRIGVVAPRDQHIETTWTGADATPLEAAAPHVVDEG